MVIHTTEQARTADVPASPIRFSLKRASLYAAAAAVLVLILFGVLLLRVTRTPDDRRVDAELAAMRQKMERKRSETVAAIADRIVQAPMGRRAQEALLNSTEEDLAGSSP